MRKKAPLTMKAYDDPEFIHGHSARSIRVLIGIHPTGRTLSEERNPQYNRIFRISTRHA